MNSSEYTPMQAEWIVALIFFVIVITVAVIIAVRLAFRLGDLSALEEKVGEDASDFVTSHIAYWYGELGRVPLYQIAHAMDEYYHGVFLPMDTDLDIKKPTYKVHRDGPHVVVSITVGNYTKSTFYSKYYFEEAPPEAACMVAH